MTHSSSQTATDIAALVREEWGTLFSALNGYLHDFQLAEDCLQDALESALIHWHRNGFPRSPKGWLLQTARRKAIDRLRRAKNFESKQRQYSILLELEREVAFETDEHDIKDDRLRLIFTCCHPALDEKSRVALTLRSLGGLTTGEIAVAFLDKEEAMAQRLVRAKRKIKDAAIPYKVPEAREWAERLNTVLSVIYFIFNEGYRASSGAAWMRNDLCAEAIRLARALLHLCPGESEVCGLLALLLLHNSRRASRIGSNGEIIMLSQQDRSQWDQQQISDGVGLLEQNLSQRTKGPFILQAAISAVHAEAPTHDQTRWSEIVLLYAELYRFQPTAVIRMNQAIALSYATGPEQALEVLQPLGAELASYQPFHAALADCLERAGEHQAALSAYQRAIELSGNAAERAYLAGKQQKLGRRHLV